MEITDFDVSGSDPEPALPPAVHEAPITEPSAPVIEEKAQETGEEPLVHDDEPQGRDEQGKFAPKKSVQARIDRVTFEREEARREAARERAERERLSAELAALRAPKAPEAPKVAAPAADEPTLNNFETYDDWVKAWSRWDNKRQVAEALAAERATQHAEQTRRTQHEQMQRFQTQLASARQQYADWDAVIANSDAAFHAAGVQLPEVMKAAILNSPNATEIMRDLATHPEDAIQLARENASTHVSAAPLMRSVLERRLASSAAHSGPAAPPVRSIAPAPIKPVGSAPVVTDAIPSDDADFDTHRAYWDRKDKERRR